MQITYLTENQTYTTNKQKTFHRLIKTLLFILSLKKTFIALQTHLLLTK